MAYTLDHVPSTGLFTRFAEALIALGENSSRGRIARKIASMSDEDLAAHGTTRVALVQRTLGAGIS